MLNKGKRFLLVPLLAMLLAPTTVMATAVDISFCERFQTVLDNQYLEGADLNEFQYFVDMLQPNNADINGSVYVDTTTLRIPKVSGLTEAEAVAILQAWNFNVVESFTTPHPTVPAGVVIRTDPEEGKKVVPGSDVRLRVSTGPGTEETPSTDIPQVEFVGDIQGNGIKDVANEFGLLEKILNDESFDNGVLNHETVYNAWTANMAQFNTDLGPLASAVLPNMVDGIKEVFVAYLTLRDGGYTIISKPAAGEFHGYLSGGNEAVPNASTAIGKVDVIETIETVDDVDVVTGVTFHVEHDVQSPVQAGLWMRGTPDTLVVDFGSASGSFDYTLTPEEFALFDWTQEVGDSSYWDNYYINVTSTAYPDGEILGEMRNFEPAPFAATGNGSFGIIAGMIAMLNDLIVDAVGFGFDNSELQQDAYVGLDDLLPESDADGDGASNRCEYDWFEHVYCPEILWQCSPELLGSNEVEAVTTGKKGTSKIRAWYDRNQADAYLTIHIEHNIPVADITTAGIFQGGPGENGPLVYQFPSGKSPIDVLLTQEDMASFPQQIYINILTTEYPEGLIRANTDSCGGDSGKSWVAEMKKAAKTGPLYSDAALDSALYPDYCVSVQGCKIALTPDEEVPPAGSMASGTLQGDSLWYLNDQASGVHLYIEHNVEHPVSAGIYLGGPGETGELVIDLGNPASPIDVVLDPQQAALLSSTESYYVNITSTEFADGEIRGQFDCRAKMRVLHASPDASAVNVCAAGVPVFVNAEYGIPTDLSELYSSNYEIKVVPETGDCDTEALLSLDEQLLGSASYTLVVTDFAEQLNYLLLRNATAPAGEGEAKIRFVHLSPSRMLANLALDGTPVFENVSYADVAGYDTVTPGTYDVSVAAVTKDALVTKTSVELLPGGVYSFYFIGLDGGSPDPDLLTIVDVEGSAVVEGDGEGGEGCPVPNCTGPLTFTDSAVETVVRAGIEKPTGDIQPADVTDYVAFNGREAGITQICGVECLSALTYFNVSLNSNLSDISPLAALTNLQAVDLSVCPVSDISALQGLTNLSEIRVIATNVTDFSAFVNNTGLGAGDVIYANGITTTPALCDQVVALRARGVTVYLVDEGQEDPCGGFIEGEGEASTEGDGEAATEGDGEAATEGDGEAATEGDGEAATEGDGEASTEAEIELGPHSADQDANHIISLTELLRVIQFFNSGGFHCVVPPATSEDGYLPGLDGDHTCTAHSSDYNPQNWQISLTELLRLIQFFNSGGYHECLGQNTEDDYCPGL